MCLSFISVGKGDEGTSAIGLCEKMDLKEDLEGSERDGIILMS